MPRIPLIETKDSIAPEHHAIYDAIVESRGAVRGSFPARCTFRRSPITPPAWAATFVSNRS